MLGVLLRKHSGQSEPREKRELYSLQKNYISVWNGRDMDTTEGKGGLRLPYYVWIWKVWSTSGVMLCSPTVL